MNFEHTINFRQKRMRVLFVVLHVVRQLLQKNLEFVFFHCFNYKAIVVSEEEK